MRCFGRSCRGMGPRLVWCKEWGWGRWYEYINGRNMGGRLMYIVYHEEEGSSFGSYMMNGYPIRGSLQSFVADYAGRLERWDLVYRIFL